MNSDYVKEMVDSNFCVNSPNNLTWRDRCIVKEPYIDEWDFAIFISYVSEKRNEIIALKKGKLACEIYESFVAFSEEVK